MSFPREGIHHIALCVGESDRIVLAQSEGVAVGCLAVGVKHEVSACRNRRALRERDRSLVSVIRRGPPGYINIRLPGVEQLNPIVFFAFGHNLVDTNRAGLRPGWCDVHER